MMSVLAMAGTGAVVGEANGKAQTLFESQDEIRLVLEAPISSLKKTRSTKPEVEGRLFYFDAQGGQQALDVRIAPRGKSRLKICSFPPLKLIFDKKQILGTPFEGHRKLKLVTHCRASSEHRTYVRQEFQIYQALQKLTDKSYRSRFVDMTYRDLEKRGKTYEEPAFLIENSSAFSRRTGLERVETKRVRLDQIDPDYLSMVTLFQYMIGNTDWSARASSAGADCCHNGHVYGPEGEVGRWLVVPYDFDYAGLINAHYAKPSKSASVESVRERFYRGFCSNGDRLPATIEAFNRARPDIEFALTSGLSSKRLSKGTLRYLKDFYKTINDPKSLKRRVVKDCKPK